MIESNDFMTLVFDTETTGKADFNLPLEHLNQPRLVQLGAILFDEVLETVTELNVLIKPNGWTISPGAEAVHGISMARAIKYGMNEKPVLNFFAGLCLRAKVIVAHNLQFDGLIIGKAMHANGLTHTLPEVKFCTMQSMTDICKLPGRFPGKYKWPTLQEAYKHCFGKEFSGAHGAIADAKACAEIYKWLCEGNQSKSGKA